MERGYENVFETPYLGHKMMGTILNNHTALRKGDERLPMWK
jgi:hypothetical protein